MRRGGVLNATPLWPSLVAQKVRDTRVQGIGRHDDKICSLFGEIRPHIRAITPKSYLIPLHGFYPPCAFLCFPFGVPTATRKAIKTGLTDL